MPSNVTMHKLEIPKTDSDCEVWREVALVFTDEENNCKAIPWSDISNEIFNPNNPLAEAIIDGYAHVCYAVYCGLNDDNEAVFMVYQRAS